MNDRSPTNQINGRMVNCSMGSYKLTFLFFFFTFVIRVNRFMRISCLIRVEVFQVSVSEEWEGGNEIGSNANKKAATNKLSEVHQNWLANRSCSRHNSSYSPIGERSISVRKRGLDE